jgi:hypothetical protein
MNVSRIHGRARSRRLVALTALAVLGGSLSMVAAPTAMALAPEPAPVPKRWQLEIETSPLRLTTVQLPGGEQRAYFYLTFKVTNNTATDLLFAPSFELATDELVVLRSGRGVTGAATAELIERMQNPLLMDQIDVVGTLLRGEENAREALVAWPMPATFQSEISVYCAGFSGETATVEVPDPVSGKTEKKLLRKTRELRFRLPGELSAAAGLELVPVEERWIMR